MAKPVIARIDQAGFVREESFKTKADADHWVQMVIETLNHRARIDFDLTLHTRLAWPTAFVPTAGRSRSTHG